MNHVDLQELTSSDLIEVSPANNIMLLNIEFNVNIFYACVGCY